MQLLRGKPQQIYNDMSLLIFFFFLTLSVPEKLKNSIFGISVIPKILNIKN